MDGRAWDRAVLRLTLAWVTRGWSGQDHEWCIAPFCPCLAIFGRSHAVHGRESSPGVCVHRCRRTAETLLTCLRRKGIRIKKATFHKSPAYVSKHQPQGGLWRQQEKNLLGALKAQPLAYPTVRESQKKRKCIAYEITAGMVVIVGDCNALAFCSAYQTQPTSSIWYHGESFPPAVPVWVNHLQMIHKICSKSGKQKISPKKASFTIIRDVRATFPLLMLSPASRGSWPSLFTSSFWDIQL